MNPARPYGGIRIIDLAGELGSYATRLFADLGAEVIRVELPEGGSDRRIPPLSATHGGMAFEYLNLNKRSVVVDYRLDAGRQVLRDLVATAQAVVYQADDDCGTLLPLFMQVPGARVFAVLSYFGLTGPYGGYLGSDLVAQAAGGLAWLSGRIDGPPLRIAGEQGWFVTSLYTATATAMALWDVEHKGATHVLDIAAQECLAHSLQNTLEAYSLEGRVTRRGGEGTRDATESIFACQDGYVFLAAPLQLTSAWSALLQWLKDEGHPGHARLSEPDWQVAKSRATAELHAEFRQIFESFTAGKTKSALLDAALARKVLLSPVSTIADTIADDQLQHRDFFRAVHHPALGRDIVIPGAPYLMSEPVWSVDHAAPAVGADNALLKSPGGGR
jgi:benzylsuccinate CoA-transferase BbsE subunit